VRQAIDIVRAVPGYDELGEAEALYNWVKRNIRFVKDPVTKEKLYPPRELLKIKAGDCDDIAMLLGAFFWPSATRRASSRLAPTKRILRSFRTFTWKRRFRLVPHNGFPWMDSQFGIEPPIYFRKRAWSLTDDSYQDLSGADCGCGCGKRTCKPVGLGSYGTVKLGQDITDGSGGAAACVRKLILQQR
jgi:hypothetical protein